MDSKSVADGTMATLIKKAENFRRFGPSILAREVRGQSKEIKIDADRMAARKVVRDHCPLVPGVYGWLNHERQLVYVGKSKCLRKRLLSYFAKRAADPKMDRIRQHSESIVFEPISHELLALLREQELIHRWRPEFNSMGQPTRMQPAFLCIAGSPAPNARLVRRLTGRYDYSFGPISGTKQLTKAIESLNQAFQLRDCPDKTKFEFENQGLLFGNLTAAKCIRHELGSCPGPCAALCTAENYSARLHAAVRFLQGHDQTTLASISDQMQAAADRQAFESAAIFRDRWKRLRWLDRKLQGLRMAHDTLNGVLEIDARRNRMAWVILSAGRIVDTFLRPATADQAEIALEKVCSIESESYRLPSSLLEMGLQLIVIGWFRKYPEIKSSFFTFEQIADRCRTIQAGSD